jgi:hypothetical protein
MTMSQMKTVNLRISNGLLHRLPNLSTASFTQNLRLKNDDERETRRLIG